MGSKNDSEDFNIFLNKFFSDKNFQKDRIVFPLNCTFDLRGNEKNVKFYKTTWEFQYRELDFKGKYDGGDQYLKNDIIDSLDTKLLTFAYYEDNEFFLFKVQNKKWYLIRYTSTDDPRGQPQFENFDTFLNKFFSDSKFQLNRISFPIIYGSGPELDKYTRWNKSDWKILKYSIEYFDATNFYDDSFGTNYHYFKKTELGNSIKTYLHVHYSKKYDGGGYVLSFLFKTIDGEWILTRYSEAEEEDNFTDLKSSFEILNNNISSNARIISSYSSTIELKYFVSQNLSEGQECTIYDLSNNKLVNGNITFIDGSNVTIEVQQIFNNKILKSGSEVFVEFK